jgi:hypothetical protein
VNPEGEAARRASRQDIDRLLLELVPSLHHLQISDVTVLIREQSDNLLAEIHSIHRPVVLRDSRGALRGNLRRGLIEPVLSRLQSL